MFGLNMFAELRIVTLSLQTSKLKTIFLKTFGIYRILYTIYFGKNRYLFFRKTSMAFHFPGDSFARIFYIYLKNVCAWFTLSFALRDISALTSLHF